MPKPDVLGIIQESSLMVVIDKVDTKIIEELLGAGVKIFELRLDGGIFYASAEKETNKLRSIVGEDVLVGVVGIRSRDQIEACSGPCNFFTPGSGEVRDEILRGLVKISYCFGAGDVYRDNEVKPRKLYRYPGGDYEQYLTDLLTNFGYGHELIVTSRDWGRGNGEIYRLFREGACAVEVEAKDISARTDDTEPTSVDEIVSQTFAMIEQGKAAYAHWKWQESKEE